MKIVNLTDTIAVSEQVLASDVAAIAAAGFKVLINNRPDGEAPDQPSSAEIAAAAKDNGLRYYHLPITAGNFPGPDVLMMAELFDDSSAPVLAFCRTGTRCTNLWVATRNAEAAEAATGQARKLGYDLAMSSRA
jgi:uncharacterized protein (TIGR01244 family)